jgi:hypothetical protein
MKDRVDAVEASEYRRGNFAHWVDPGISQALLKLSTFKQSLLQAAWDAERAGAQLPLYRHAIAAIEAFERRAQTKARGRR